MGDETNPALVASVELLRLRPGDILLVTVPPDATDREVEHLAKQLRQTLDGHGHSGVPGLVLYGDIKVRVARAEEGDTE